MDTSHLQGVYYYSNRGVSGIDGSLSTASGAAYASERITTLIVGDLGFMYDMNGLWNKNLSPNLRIIVINNGGGGIFRIIDSRETPLLEKYFEAVHNMKVEPFAKAFEIPYYAAYDEESLRQGLSSLYQDVSSKGLGGKRPVILEVFTPRTINAEVLLDYFNFLKK
jgi:2-succinyl-5-enolpyruvyl-6-hydroxy-3-cyclohexene-1-carboxylate synthase